MYITRLEKNGVVKYSEWETKQQAEDMATFGAAYDWKWNVYKMIRSNPAYKVSK